MLTRWIVTTAAVFGLVVSSVPLAGANVLVAQASGRDAAKAKKMEGDQLFKAKKAKAAEAAYQAAIKADPDWYKAYEALGNLLFANKRYADAIESFMKAVEVEPRYHTGLYNIAFAYRKSRNYDKAIEYYKKYIGNKPQDPDARYGLAAAYEAAGKKKEAIASYLGYADMEKRPSEKKYVIKARNKADQLRKELDAEAPAKVAAAPAKTPESKPAAPKTTAPAKKDTPAVVATSATGSQQVKEWIGLGDAAMQKGKFTKAMKHYFDAARAEPRNCDAVYKLGLVYEKTGNLRAAELKWRTVLKIDAEHQPSMLALERLKSGKKPAAVAVAPAAKPEPKPVVKPEPKPVVKPELKPVVKPEPTPVVKPEPNPVVKPAPKPKALASVKLTPDQKKSLSKIEQGDSAFKQKSFAKAISLYTHATQLDPKNEQAMFKLATAYAYAGNLNVAVFKWKQVLRLNPNNASAKRNIERAQAKVSGKVSGKAPATAPASKTPAPKAKPVAKPTPKPATKPEPKPEPKPAPKPAAVASAAKKPPKAGSFEAHMDDAQAAKRKGDAKAVLAATERALKKKKVAAAAILRGEALVVLKRYSDAKKAFSQAMVLDPNLAAPFYGLGEACRLSGEKDRARYYFKMYIRSKARDVKPKLVKKIKTFLSNS